MISWLFIGLVATILLTPGPTNTLLASSGVQVGLRKSVKLIPAEVLGYLASRSALSNPRQRATALCFALERTILPSRTIVRQCRARESGK